MVDQLKTVKTHKVEQHLSMPETCYEQLVVEIVQDSIASGWNTSFSSGRFRGSGVSLKSLSPRVIEKLSTVGMVLQQAMKQGIGMFMVLHYMMHVLTL